MHASFFGYSYVILCKANPLRGKTFVVRKENLHAWENFCGSMLLYTYCRSTRSCIDDRVALNIIHRKTFFLVE